MNRRAHRTERGQSIVLLAFAFVAMLGFASLAVDGGLLYTERRRAQNGADAAALAGALAIVYGNDPYGAAFARAADNTYDNNGTYNWVEVYNPPAHGPYAGNPEYVEVVITAKVDTVLAHFVYSGELRTTVTAIARARPGTIAPLLDGNAIVGLSPTGCSVVWTHGNSTATVDGSGVFVNSDDPDCAFRASGGNTFNVTGGDINVVGGFEIANNSTVWPVPISGATPVETPVIPAPTCSGTATIDAGTGTITAGYIDSFNFHGGTWTLGPGIYCVDNGFAINSGTILNGHDVLIYVMSGDVAWNGGAEIHLDAPDDGDYAGLLVYQDPGNTDMAVINGNSASTFTGTIFIPGAEVQIAGTGAADGFHSQVVGWKVDLTGTSDTHIIYNPDENYRQREPPRVDLSQ
ncbi:MAG: hypothetical protein A2Y93_09045 [Chloroflexi bacterium RBG_13_68_17]|nr:MAG: hypothetical protein A2Y93_09045 [Chloroflexi bacterium RBG_13_68_17]